MKALIQVTVVLHLISGSSACTTLACQCLANANAIYVNETQSCIRYYGSYTWFRGFLTCQKLARDTFTIDGLAGRLAVLDNDVISNATFWGQHNRLAYIGMRSPKIGNVTVMEDYQWTLDPHNTNAARNVMTDVTYVTPDLADADNECVQYWTNINYNSWENTKCYTKRPSFCETFVDQCLVSDPCVAPKVCIPDAKNRIMCVCPMGAPDPDDINCGVDCSGKPDGNYPIGVCTKHHFSCASGTPTVEECASNEMFDPFFGICNQTTLECKCIEEGGKYIVSSSSCFVNGGIDKIWYLAQQGCSDLADSWNMKSLAARLPHLTTRQLISDATDVADATNYWTGMRASSESIGNTSVWQHYRWWLTSDNPNAVDPVAPLDYFDVGYIDRELNDCAYIHSTTNQLHDVGCIASNMRAICEIFYDQCSVSDPCVPPKVCVPDLHNQARCFCPRGAENDPNCGVDCNAKPDGDYAVGSCTPSYYSCAGGHPLLHQCNPGQVFDGDLGICNVTWLGCECTEEISWKYSFSSSSCYVNSHSLLTWFDNYKICSVNRPKLFGITGLYGRLAHLTTPQIIKDAAWTSRGYTALIGMRAGSDVIANSTDWSDYRWRFDLDNQNAVEPVVPSNDFNSVEISERTNDCIYLESYKILKDTPCRDKTMRAMCEIFYNHCSVSDPCIPPKVCVPDVKKQVKCFCPGGAVNDESCGVDCDGMIDGDYAVGTCTPHYFTCSGGFRVTNPTYSTCNAGQVFDAQLGICSDTWLGCECTELGGKYILSTSSCLVKGLVDNAWHYAFKETCGDWAKSWNTPGLYGRLPHLTRPEVVAELIDISKSTYTFVGMKALSESIGNSTSLSDFGWWLDADNPNAVDRNVSQVDYIQSMTFGARPADDCSAFDPVSGQVQVKGCWERRRAICEIFYDQCSVSDPCDSPKVCVPDVNNQAKCFCPIGAENDPNCGVDCNGKTDGDYAVGTCTPYYYTCSGGTPTLHTCSDNQTFDAYLGICSETWLGCKCIEEGGKYTPSTESCFFNTMLAALWYPGFKTTCADTANDWGIAGLHGRLPLLRKNEAILDVVDISRGSVILSAMRSASEAEMNAIELSDYRWWLDPDNPNALDPVSLVDYIVNVQYLDRANEDCTGFHSGNGYMYGKAYTTNMRVVCEIFYNQCSVSDPCVPPKVCVPDVKNQGRCFCPGGAENDTNCGVDCSGKIDGDYAVGVAAPYYYTCSSGSSTLHSCQDGQIYHPMFKLCASTSFANECWNDGGVYVYSTASCIKPTKTTATWTDSFLSCQTYAIDNFGPGHVGRLAHALTNEMIIRIYHLMGASHGYIGLRRDELTTDINDYRWWQNPYNNTNSTPIDTEKLPSVKMYVVSNVDYKCMIAPYNTFERFYQSLCSSKRKGICEVIFDPEYDPETESTCRIDQPCQNNGTCVERIPLDGFYECDCAEGWTGINCTDPDVCVLESPCHNGANCTDGPGLEYSCDCAPDLIDKNCTIKDWCYSTPCGNGGSCSNTDNYESYLCNCTEGWLLPNCTHKAPQCPARSQLKCNGTLCSCKRNSPQNESQIEFVQIGRDVRGSEGITVSIDNKHTATQCGMVCSRLEKCSFYSYKPSSGECLIHHTIIPSRWERGYNMFAKIT